MFISKKFLAAATIASFLIVPSAASANDRDVITTTIPATACRPSSDSEDAKVILSNGAYVFNGSATGTVTFYCPLPINTYTISDFTNDNDISSYRVFYRDSDGIGTAAQVTTRLTYRDSAGLNAAGSIWSSNISTTTVNTSRIVNLSHDLGSLYSDRLYSFVVTMQRTNTTQTPAFAGIDFPVIPPG